MEYLGAWGSLIHEKKLRPKISCQTPFKRINHTAQIFLTRPSVSSCVRHGYNPLERICDMGTNKNKYEHQLLLHDNACYDKYRHTKYTLKRVWHDIFDSRFFSWISTPKPLSILLGLLSLFLKIFRDNREWMFISGVNNTGDKLFGGANDTTDKFITGVNDTRDKSLSRISVIGGVLDTSDNLSLVL